MSYMNQPGIILLREGTDSSQGKAQLVSNINACQVCVVHVCVCVFVFMFVCFSFFSIARANR